MNLLSPSFMDALATDVSWRWRNAMLDGNFEEAWRQTDRIELIRRKKKGVLARPSDCLMWDGSDFRGKDVIVRCLHGLGDTIQFLRFLPRLCKMAHSVHLLAQPHLVSLLSRCRGIGHIHDGWVEWQMSGDVEIEIMELAYAFRVTSNEIRKHVAYISIDRCPEKWRHLWHFHNKFKVGLIWEASDWNLSRSIPIKYLNASFSTFKDIQFFCLQQGPAVAEAEDAAFPLEVISQQTIDPLDAATCMLELDLIISVDTFAAHLAGALGRPIWLLLQHQADWRWMRNQLESPWYPTMKIFRQSSENDWESVVCSLEAILKKEVDKATHS